MVQKYTLAKGREQVTERYNVQTNTKLKPIYNGFPGSSLPVITNNEPDLINFLQWGMIPYDSVDPMIGDKLVHAKIELIKAKKPFADLISTQRCLIPADGFILWTDETVPKPFQVTLKSKEIFSIAGIWDSWNDEYNETSFLKTFSMITTKATESLTTISDRMPAIISKEQESLWLNPNTNTDQALNCLQHITDELLTIRSINDDIIRSEENNQTLLNDQSIQSPGQSFDLFQ